VADGWHRGTVARICAPSTSGYTDVLAYNRQTSALCGTVNSLLDAASYGQRWVLLSPLATVGVERVSRRNRELSGSPGTRRPDLGIEVCLCAKTGSTGPEGLGKFNRPGN
jgi:hypothetical protein